MIGRKQLSIFQILTLTATFAMLLAACQPTGNHPQTASPVKTAADIVYEEELRPTWEEPVENARGIIYEKPSALIQNPTAEIIVGQVKMANVFMTYSTADRSLKVSGVARLFDKQQALVADSDFNLVGSHALDVGSVNLKPSSEVKSNSDEKPVVRGKATCLDVNEADQYNCSHVVIDFFIAYKKEIYTQQMEVKRTPKIDKKELPSAPNEVTPLPTAKEDEGDDDDDTAEVEISRNQNEKISDVEAKDTAPEGKERSILGPYRGTVANADLTKIFEDDEAKVIKPRPAPVAPPVKPILPIKPMPNKPASGDATAPKTKPEIKPAPPTAKPALPADPPKSSVPADSDKTVALNKNYKQVRGELRQYNQSIGYVNNGSLRNATSILIQQESLAASQKAFFEIRTPENKNFFATYEMAKLIERMGERMNKTFTRKLYVGSVSLQNGGKISPHLSHQIGIDADLGYPTTIDGVKFPVVAANETSKGRTITKLYQNRYSRELTYDVLKFAFSQPDIKIERIFIDRAIKADLCQFAIDRNEFKGPDKELVQQLFESMDHVTGHGNHFHLRLRCSNEDPACRTKLYLKNKGCGIIK